MARWNAICAQLPARERARAHGQSHGANGLRGMARLLGHGVEGQSGGSSRACDLVDEDRSSETATAGEMAFTHGKRAVVAYHNHAYLQASRLGFLTGEPKIEPVPGVVLDDDQASRGSSDGEESRQHAPRRWAREHVSRDCGAQHTGAYPAPVGRLVAAASACTRPRGGA